MCTKLSAPCLNFTALFLGFGLCISPASSDDTAAATEPGQLPAQVDLRPLFEKWGLERRQQGRRPTCSVFTIVGALEFAMAKPQLGGEWLSVEYLNWAANQERLQPRDGGFFSDIWNGFAAYGICREQEMPYRAEFDSSQTPSAALRTAAKARLAVNLKLNWIKKWNVSTGLTDSEFVSLKRTLHQGWPVCGGFRWPKREQWKSDALQMCPPDQVYDGHSVLLVGYRDDPEQPALGVFVFRNTSRGGRDGFMPYAFARAYLNDAAWIKPADKGKPDDSRAGAAQQGHNH